jgi:DNA modification methylase
MKKKKRKSLLLVGDVREKLKELPDNSINCCVTSPPYWGLRDYGTATWVGGDPNCSHKRDSKFSPSCSTGQKLLEGAIGDGIYKVQCHRCGAMREDSQLGLEPTVDEYVEHMVNIFREVHRVLRDDGTLWLNLGDTYNGAKVGNTNQNVGAKRHANKSFSKPLWNKLKPKDLIGIPWRVAFALQADGWYLRQDIIWAKPNPMPESVKDRCTKSHEYIFLLSKSEKYFFDNEAIKEPVKQDWGTRNRTNGKYHNQGTGLQPHTGLTKSYTTKNKRDVWTVALRPFKGAHFATFPPDLITPCILAGCPKNGLVLDPFFGAGTTGLVAQKNNRAWVGIELNPKYAEMASKRISDEALKHK